MGAEGLDDEDIPALTTGQAAAVIGVQPAFLRSLDAGQMVRPTRSAGGHRRWTRRQLALAARVRALFDEGFTLTAAWKVVSLEDRVDEVTRERDLARADLGRTRRELARVSRESAEAVKARTEPTALPGSPDRAHRTSGLRRATGSRPGRRMYVDHPCDPHGRHLAMKLIDPSRTHRPVMPRRPMPPALARIPLVDLCTCKHPREAHEHYTVAQDCAQCDCRAFARWEPSSI